MKIMRNSNFNVHKVGSLTCLLWLFSRCSSRVEQWHRSLWNSSLTPELWDKIMLLSRASNVLCHCHLPASPTPPGIFCPLFSWELSTALISCMGHFHLCTLLLSSFHPWLDITDSSLQKLPPPGGPPNLPIWFGGSILCIEIQCLGRKNKEKP